MIQRRFKRGRNRVALGGSEGEVVIGDILALAIVEPQDRPQVAMVRIKGALDAVTSARVDEILNGLLAAGRNRVVISCGGVVFISCQGLGAIIAARKHSNEAGGDLVLSNLSNACRSVFEITQLTDHLSIHDDEAAALAALGR